MRLLVVDDDSDQLWLRCMLLGQCGFDTLDARDPESALRIVADSSPDLAIVDLRLPTEEAGLRLLRDLKQSKPGLPVVVLTGADPATLNRYPERDLVDEVIVKGSSWPSLISLLKEYEHYGRRAAVRAASA